MESIKDRKHVVLMVRHSERASFPTFDEPIVPITVSDEMFVIQPHLMNKIDPAITKLGLAQANRTGIYLRKLINDHYKEAEVEIKSSPFLRCLMTASCIARKLGQKEIHIDPDWHEFLDRHSYESCPLKLLEIYNGQTVDELKTKYKMKNDVLIL